MKPDGWAGEQIALEAGSPAVASAIASTVARLGSTAASDLMFQRRLAAPPKP